MIRANFHTHTTYCDGTLSPREMVAAALERGCTALGFSGHSYTFFDESYCMSRAGTAQYRAEVAALKDEYAGRIALYCGVEQDAGSAESTKGYDYVIGSAHYVKRGGEYLPIDAPSAGGRAIFAETAQTRYGGDYYALCRDYFAEMAGVYDATGCDIVGHFDLVSKFNEDGCLFDDTDPRYTGLALDALCALLERGCVFEVNTGQMYKLGKKNPFPAPFLLREIYSRGGGVILSSDSHDAASICHRFEETGALLRAIGFRTVRVWTERGLEETVL